MSKLLNNTYCYIECIILHWQGLRGAKAYTSNDSDGKYAWSCTKYQCLLQGCSPGACSCNILHPNCNILRTVHQCELCAPTAKAFGVILLVIAQAITTKLLKCTHCVSCICIFHAQHCCLQWTAAEIARYMGSCSWQSCSALLQAIGQNNFLLCTIVRRAWALLDAQHHRCNSWTPTSSTALLHDQPEMIAFLWRTEN